MAGPEAAKSVNASKNASHDAPPPPVAAAPAETTPAKKARKPRGPRKALTLSTSISRVIRMLDTLPTRDALAVCESVTKAYARQAEKEKEAATVPVPAAPAQA